MYPIEILPGLIIDLGVPSKKESYPKGMTWTKIKSLDENGEVCKIREYIGLNRYPFHIVNAMFTAAVIERVIITGSSTYYTIKVVPR